MSMDSKFVSQHYPGLKNVQVPEVDYKKLSWGKWTEQKIRRFLIPTTADDFQTKVKYFREEFRESVQEYNEYLVHRSHRLSLLLKLTNTLNVGAAPEQWDSDFDDVGLTLKSLIGAKDGVPSGMATRSMREYNVLNIVPSGFASRFDEQPVDRLSDQLSASELTLVDEYCESIERSKTLKNHLDEVEKDLENYAYLAMLQLTDGLSTALITISTLGAGLVYSTVFSASRDAQLMSYAFPFFSLGFMVPVVVQIALRWAAGLQKEVKFASQQVWTVLTGLFLFISSVAVMAAITILNLTIFFFDPTADSTKGTANIPGIIAFAVSGSIFFVILLGVILSIIATRVLSTMRGFRTLIVAMYGAQARDEDALKNYTPV
ncbi:hypothetical protein D9757_001388 [Collybiopsis confluens]|uniref:Uncharacterized protein n=1 Tax=Collybiopsis confluens TaxID=2823264 RepID=A0A8H5MFP2_9AGAR|nr:hypothetical protein D9757_001388 [Collybiopsis confluens]